MVLFAEKNTIQVGQLQKVKPHGGITYESPIFWKRGFMHRNIPRDYSLIAPIYDNIFNPLLSEGHRKIGDFLNQKMKNSYPHHLHVLEVGVGSGLTLSYVPSDLLYTGVDVNENMLNLAFKKLQKMPHSNINLSLMNAQELKFKSNYFDVVFAASVLTAVDQPEVAVEEMIRVTKKKGVMAIVANVREKKGLCSVLVRKIDPFTKKFLGFRTDLELDFFRQFKNIKLIKKEKTNTILGISLSDFFVFEKM